MRSYYPKSQIKSELYTNGGEFALKNGGAEYRGLYHEVAGGRYFTGANANSTPTQELVLISGILDVYEDGIIPYDTPKKNLFISTLIKISFFLLGASSHKCESTFRL